MGACTPGRGVRRESKKLPAALAVLLAAGLLVVSAGPARADAGEASVHQGFTYSSGATIPTADKPQSKLWYHDGSWWGILASASGPVTVHELMDDHTWRDTGAVVHTSAASRGDALPSGSRVYVASRTGSSLQVTRLDYDASARSWSGHGDFPVGVGSGGSESVAIARDGTGRLWITYTQGSQVWVAHSLAQDSQWSAPFVPAVSGTSLTSDDISAISTVPGGVAIVWSNQADDAFYYSSHADGAPATSWSATETARAGTEIGEDHINIATAADGRLYAVIKTSLNGSGSNADDPLIELLVREPAGGWSAHQVARVANNHTRPIVVLEADGSRVHVAATAPESGGVIYLKSSATDAISFGPGLGTAVISWPGADINNVTGTKQPVDGSTGLVLLAADSGDRRYYHAEIPIAPPPPPPPPPAEGDIAVRGASAANNDDAAALDLPLPAGTTDGDLLLASVDVRGRPSITAPAGWTEVRTDENSTTQKKATYWKIASSEPASFTFAFSRSQSAAGTILAFTNVDAGDPVPAHSGQTASSSTTITAPSVTAPVDGTMLVGLFGIAWDTDIAPPSEMTEQAQAASSAGRYDVTSQASTEALRPAGATGDRVAFVAKSRGNVGQLVALRPAAPGGTPTPPPSPTPTPDPDPSPTPDPDPSPAPGPTPTPSPTAPPSGSIDLRGAAAGANEDATTLDLPLPAGTQAGDLVLATVDARGKPHISAPSGFELLRDDENGNVIKKATYWKIATASEPAVYTFEFHKSQSASGVVVSYDGVDAASPFVASAGTTGAPGNELTAPSVGGAAGGRLVAMYGIGRDAAISAPGSMSHLGAASSTAGRFDVSSAAADEVLTQSGPTGDRVATASGSAAWNTHTVVLRPEVGT